MTQPPNVEVGRNFLSIFFLNVSALDLLIELVYMITATNVTKAFAVQKLRDLCLETNLFDR